MTASHRRGPWRAFEAVEFATLTWVDWFNNRLLLEPIGNIPPAEAEERCYAMLDGASHGGVTQTKRPPGNPERFMATQLRNALTGLQGPCDSHCAEVSQFFVGGETLNILMHSDEIALLSAFLSSADAYFEFGMGGSTCLAASLVRRAIHAIDSSPEWVTTVTSHIGDVSSKSIRLQHIDIGPIGPWGAPLSRVAEPKFLNYSRSILETGRSDYDLCLVDGRFRVACFLQALTYLSPAAVIGIHDYDARPEYHLIENYARPIASARQLSFFVRRRDCDMAGLEADLVRHRTQWH